MVCSTSLTKPLSFRLWGAVYRFWNCSVKLIAFLIELVGLSCSHASRQRARWLPRIWSNSERKTGFVAIAIATAAAATAPATVAVIVLLLLLRSWHDVCSNFIIVLYAHFHLNFELHIYAKVVHNLRCSFAFAVLCTMLRGTRQFAGSSIQI